MQKFTAIVLAAGKGVRMKSATPKVLQPVCGQPMIHYVLQNLCALQKYVGQVIVVVSPQTTEIKNCIKNRFKSVEFCLQKKALGTADAVKSAIKQVKGQQVLVLCADTPLIKKETLASFMAGHLKDRKLCSLISAQLNQDNDLGRLFRDDCGQICRIVEKINLGPVAATEINSGIYCFQREWLKTALPKIKPDPRKGEYFLTDTIELAYQQGQPAKSFALASILEVFGVNTLNHLVEANQVMQQRILEEFISQGIRIIDPKNTYIEAGVKIGKETIIYPFTFIENNVKIGTRCSLGPFIRLRKGTSIAANTQLGNFLEINRCRLGKHVKVKHFSYLGDASIGDFTNIGAGTVIANYDGKLKQKTVIGRHAFIGSDTVIVAPAKIGDAAVTGAGSVVTKDVAKKTVVVGVPAKIFKTNKHKNI